jgi:micrococcal nuclease
MYNYAATVLRVIDGDTLELHVDCGFSMWFKGRFRILGINAPEMKKATHRAGTTAKEFLEKLLPVSSVVEVWTTKPDHFGRWLAKVNLPDGRDVAKLLLESGNAVPFMQ